ncbi:hypothetical protein HNY73_011226 [Argiope bruennichi]|uniref:Uncharacterized protein n=1 Tax=Argiope bruennichi TaxID=94029 RepID=A0A8T0F9P9_ARGBR|nr:hypothetical protein HNY73_011226 [Argiope bruennichi]
MKAAMCIKLSLRNIAENFMTYYHLTENDDVHSPDSASPGVMSYDRRPDKWTFFLSSVQYKTFGESVEMWLTDTKDRSG